MVKFLIGLFIGGFIGIMAMALCVASGNADREMEREIKMMKVINHEKERNCRDCEFHKIIDGTIPKHYCAAALPNEDWRAECPLEVKEEDNGEESV